MGTYSDGSECVNCTAGSYKAIAGNSTSLCLACHSDSTTLTDGATTVDKCCKMPIFFYEILIFGPIIMSSTKLLSLIDNSAKSCISIATSIYFTGAESPDAEPLLRTIF